MTDYGHDLQFGTFLTPFAHDPEGVVALAELTESAGLDLATFQDHPYNAAFLDTWTLMSWVAARTSRITLSGNVLNLPLRPPAMLARSAASLDLLSDGRFALGLGAGAFWDPIAGMGVPKLSPGESIDALSEAIGLIRGVWEDSTPGRLRFSGAHYNVPGMQRGPRPAHEIGIWLGAYKPRMLRLTGEKAEGWLPSLGYLQPEDVAASNRTIDEAAQAAGRNPREIRRLLNLGPATFADRNRGFLQGPIEQWIEQLGALALEHGFGTFILGGDNPQAIAIFASEVAPAVREMVAKERASRGTATGAVRSNLALSKRREGISYDAVPESLRDEAIEPGDFAYDRVRHTYIRKGSPGLVIQPEDADRVKEALAFARSQPVPLAIRSGGHGISGRSTNDGGIVIDLSKLNRIEVLHRERRLVRIEPGATWGHVAETLAPHGLAISSGDYGDVGVGGLATAGGIGYMARKYGLTIDRLTAAEIVVADGRHLRVDDEHEPDLFWAIRGAGGNFGIVTAFEFDASEVGNVVFALLVVDATDTARFLTRWGQLVEDAPRELTSFLTMVPARGDTPPLGQFVIVYAGEEIPAATAALTPFFELGPLLHQQAQLAPYAAVVAPNDGLHAGQGLDYVRSGLVNHITPEIAGIVQEMLLSGDSTFMQFRAAGGAANDVPADATAYAHRHQNFSFLASTFAARRARQERHWERLAPLLDGMYLSFETDTHPERLRDAFPEPTLGRLRDLKAKWDPDNVFNQNFNIVPESVIAL
jgi:FAD/FMN-containing dehydrogenase